MDEGDQYASMLSPSNKRGMTSEDRRKKRSKKKQKSKLAANQAGAGVSEGGASSLSNMGVSDDHFAQLLKRNEDELLNFVAQVNHVYEDKLKKPAPFMTFMLCGMQSAGKSTIMERFMNAVLNIVQEGTGTRCPLDTTCIHDDSCDEPKCELYGEELAEGREGKNLKVLTVFQSITEHNKKLGEEDRFSTEALRLVYRAKNVQNMRFVDTPGIISTKGIGKDNREDIKKILRNEMGKPNTKLCVLLEPKEFATNPIIDFCDETFGRREKWIHNATFLMTKFDKQLEDSRTGSKANKFFSEFLNNMCFPHLVITPTLPKEDLPAKELYKARLDLLCSSDSFETDRFTVWRDGHDRFRGEDPTDEMLCSEIEKRIGFGSAKDKMRQIMLEDTVKRLPEVLAELRKELSLLQKEKKVLEEKMKFCNPIELKLIVGTILYEIEKKILSYLDGDLMSAIKFPEKLQTLDDEIDEEDNSEWREKELNHYSESEDQWRDRIAEFEGEYPESVQPDEEFLGGKQVQRAIEFFRAVMIEALPDPFQLKKIVGNATGFLGGGLQRENWERAMVQITKVCVKNVSHPGINYLIKHVGCIFRKLFSLALEDIKTGEHLSTTFKLLPTAVEKHLLAEFDGMLWALMQNAANMTHLALEPMYSTVDPDLPTFHALRLDQDEGHERYTLQGQDYVRSRSKAEEHEASWLESAKSRFRVMASASGEAAKRFLKEESASRSTSKKAFLPDERTSMVTSEEKDQILSRSFEYIVALIEFNLVTLKFQLNYYLYMGFKEELGKTFKNGLMNEADWAKLAEPDPGLSDRLDLLKEKIVGVVDSLQEVERLQRRM